MNLVPTGEEDDIEPQQPIEANITAPVKKEEEPKEDKRDKLMIMKVQRRFRNNFLRVQKQMERTLQKRIKAFLFAQRKDILKMFNDDEDNVIGRMAGYFEGQKAEIIRKFEPLYTEVMETAGKLALANIGIQRMIRHGETKQEGTIEFEFEGEFIVNQELLKKRLNKVAGMNSTLFEQIKNSLLDGIEAGETIPMLQDRIRTIYNASAAKSRVIARTESASLMNGTTNQVYQEEGVEQKQWLTTIDDATRQSHVDVDGEIVPIGASFSNGLEYPGDANAPAEEVVNCRCALAPVIQ
jgi:SPP1 gp7 family putative phage head morphogenesis protein